jgi:PAS domain S-box-containing protein
MHAAGKTKSARKRTDSDVERPNGRLDRFVASAPFSIAMFDRQMNYLACSARWAELHGRGLTDLVGRNHYDVVPDTPDEWKQVHRAGLAGDTIVRQEDLWERADGSRRWLRWRVVPWVDDSGVIGGITISTDDIAAEKWIEAALSESELRLASIVHSAMDAIISINEHHVVQVFNPAASQIFGISAADAIGHPLGRFIPERLRRRHDEDIDRFAMSGVSMRRGGALGEVIGLRADGSEFPAEASISSATVAGAKLLTVILRDITERKKSDAALGEMRKQLEDVLASQVASQTLAAIAHELNQPLNAIMSYSEAALQLLRSGNPKPEQLAKALERNGQQSRRAGRILHELIEFLQRGETATESVDLEDSVLRAISIVESSGYEELKVAIESAAGARPVQANRLQIEKVIVNLLRNAAEAMQGAGIRDQRIGVTIGTTCAGDMAQVTVRDCGPGVNADMAGQVFEPFFSTKPEGIGMGLAISRSLVEKFGGTLWIDDSASGGAAFHFTLPFAS